METKFNFKSSPCTSIEQSIKLLALGLKKETSDMGIIEGRRLLNHKNSTEEVNQLVKEYVEMQERDVEMLKNYL